MPRVFENNPSNDKIVPSAPGSGVQTKDSGTIMTLIGNEEAAQVGIPLTIGDSRNVHVGDVANMRSAQVPWNKGKRP